MQTWTQKLVHRRMYSNHFCALIRLKWEFLITKIKNEHKKLGKVIRG